MIKQFLSLTIIALATFNANSQDYFGEFDGEPNGVFIRGGERPLFRLNSPLTYIDPNSLKWTAPSGEVVDGASIPQYAWSIIGGPFSGNYIRAAIIHDYYCCAKTRDFADTHKAFWRGLRLDGIGNAKANLMWAAVRAFGPNRWNVDPKRTPPVPCDLGDSAIEGKSVQVRGIAATKLIAMRRTLESTGGRVLDVIDGTVVLAESEQAAEYLDFLHDAMLENFNVPREKLGLFSNLSDFEFSQLANADNRDATVLVWNIEQVPELAAYYSDEAKAVSDAYANNGLEIGGSIAEPFAQSSWNPALNRVESIQR
ncbi:DUF1353 domain-containing protein [Hoeflea alexandrii]|uniref:DUF1353 domain-containing protein n=1 Tax=Hoeflea alexandrii TaxID=288436 RepID=A0ABT1CSK9_9HYPH|nr:DUF1353 domain-containing protein [Hoeflea alexandrii]MCO6409189.1 DUF1353 domain-containing protein [Hoeflea alexandrii]MCY0151792.1 DUF1353 domain-containing protein [Hoeflea alexandrii]